MCQGGGWEVRLVLRWRGVLSALGADLGRELACVWPFDRPLRQAQDTVRANGLGKGTLADLGRGLAGVRPFDRPLRQAQGRLFDGPIRWCSGHVKGERVPVDVSVRRVVGRAVRERPLRLRVGGRVLSPEGVGRRDVPRPIHPHTSTGLSTGSQSSPIKGEEELLYGHAGLLLNAPPKCYRCARSGCYPCARFHGAKILCCGGNVRRAFVKGSSVAGLREVLYPSRDSG